MNIAEKVARSLPIPIDRLDDAVRIKAEQQNITLEAALVDIGIASRTYYHIFKRRVNVDSLQKVIQWLNCPVIIHPIED